MWEVSAEIVNEMLQRIRPIQTDLVLKEVLKADFKADLPIEGGWGYSQMSPIKFLKQENSYLFVPMEYQIVQFLLYEELIIFRKERDRHSGIEKNLIRQRMVKENGRRFDVLEFEIICWHDFYWNALKTEWEEAHNQPDAKEDILAMNERKKNESLLRFERVFFFDITDVYIF